MTQFRRNKGAVAGAIAFLLIILLALFGPIVSGHSYDEVALSVQT